MDVACCILHVLRREYRVRGFDEVITPQVFAKELWEISGHWQNYKEARPWQMWAAGTA